MVCTHFRFFSRLSFPGMALVIGLALSPMGAWSQAPRLALDHRLQPVTSSARQAPLPDTVRVLAVMTEFQTDQDPRTSGTGAFGSVYAYDYGADILDPYPHDKAYFRAHLRFLENYVRKASNGQTILVADLIDSVITLPKAIKEYTFKKGDSEAPVARLAVDAWTAADRTAPGTAFSRYHMFVVFHAGRGRDVDMVSLQGSDPTPLDIPSLSFTLDAFQRLLGTDFHGIPVSGGTFSITNCAVLPTTDNREVSLSDGRTALLELSINGLLAAAFGTYAGLPDLFDTKTGRTGIGRFGLMDAEAIFAYGGTCPPAPNAWEKMALGWSQPRETAPGAQSTLITASRSDEPSTTDIIRVPILPQEYWLIENRQRDPGGNGQLVTILASGSEIPQRFPKDTTGYSNSDVSSLKGVVVDVEDLDWSLPGGTVISGTDQARVTGGLLIWHVDESVIEAQRRTNTVNAQPSRRGVDLEQAAGPQDIGELVNTGFGTVLATGSPLDFWFQGNISPIYANRFDGASTPDTRSNAGAHTHVAITEIGTPGPVMSLTITRGDALLAPEKGFPIDLRIASGLPQPRALLQAADVTRDGQNDILAAVWPSQPTGLGASALVAVHVDGTPCLRLPLAAVVPGITEWTAPPAVGDVNGDGVREIVLQGRTGQDTQELIVLSTEDRDSDGSFDLVARFLDLVSEAPLLTEDGLVFARRQNGSTTLVRWNGYPLVQPLPGTRVVLGAGPESGTILFASDVRTGVIRLSDGNITPLGGIDVPALRSVSRQALTVLRADLDGTGMLESISFQDNHLRIDGVKQVPEDFSRRSLPLLSSAPAFVAADLDGDGRGDLCIADSMQILSLNAASAQLVSTPIARSVSGLRAARFAGETADALFAFGDGLLTQWDTRATQASGFPLALPRNADVQLLRLPHESESHLGFAFCGEDGALSLWRLARPLESGEISWPGRLGDARLRRVNERLTTGIPPTTEFFPSSRCYNWPNPATEGITKIRFFVSEPARVTVKIYDLAGAKVTELAASALPAFENEIDWVLDGIESGVYVAVVEAVAPGHNASKVLKIAVVR